MSVTVTTGALGQSTAWQCPEQGLWALKLLGVWGVILCFHVGIGGLDSLWQPCFNKCNLSNILLKDVVL